ncbi:MAG TPA: nuclear transport factor 2 family protein [Microbacterium sp.]|uniref:nuclear transport factor 2 family protein n=1 Tax=Microbacterium sp. TaxID=51671 RepID=UPI002B48DA96|nr:nuclear transport factor 2 family protein [Microbacterium sp.]HKT55622.1 nuclear transport factor 2 family protein [Microbacterium sp.]
MSPESPDDVRTAGVDSPAAADALAAVDRIIADFGANRVDAYFAGFAPEATFLFHAEPARLESRAEYEGLWASWVAASGFEVRGCRSTNRRLQVFGDIAVFSHDVDTTVHADGELSDSHERETIVMQLRDGAWVCVHEHLSLPS